MRPTSCGCWPGTGLDGAVVTTFDKTRAGTSAQDFIHYDLIQRLGISGHCGRLRLPFCQGPRRLAEPPGQRGPAARYRGRRPGHVDIEERPVSSSAIRMALAEGQIDEATAMLRRAMVRERRGDPRREARPRSRLPHRQYPPRQELQPQARHLCGAGRPRSRAVRRGRQLRPPPDLPTTAHHCSKCSCSASRATSTALVLDVAFISFIRDELKFDTIEALIRRMDDDSARARAALAAAPDAFPWLGAIG